MSKLGIKIRKARTEIGLSQAGLAEKANICRASIVRLEDGTHIPRFDKMVTIIKTLRLPIEKIARVV